MKLWEDLLGTPDLLAETNLMGAMWRMIAGSNSNWYLRYHRGYKTYTDVEYDRGYEVEEFGISGLYSKSDWCSITEPWSRFPSKVDFPIDLTEALRAIAEEYDDDIKGLVAPYILTTSKAEITGLNLAHLMVYERMTTIRHRLQRILKDYEPTHPQSTTLNCLKLYCPQFPHWQSTIFTIQ